VNPFLRGFYFTGVRPIILTDAAPAAAAPALDPMAGGATSVFNARMLQQGQLAAAGPRGGRKVPQWVFLRRLFREVPLVDDLALRITGGGARVDYLRRALIVAAAAVLILVALWMTVSFVGNRGLVRRSVAAVSAAQAVGGVGSLVGEEDLARLDTLRERTALVTRYQRDGRPLRLAWGLYTGDELQPLLHRSYFQRFDGALWRETQERLLGYLRGLPDQPDENSDFGKAQDALAAHLLTTSEYARATPELLTPVLVAHARPMGTDTALARVERQFSFFADELRFGNPYQVQADAPLVERTQRFLRAFGPEAY
jgi:type VI secretion system protein ImpL